MEYTELDLHSNCWAKIMTEDMDFKNSCPICESKTESPQSICRFCGYNLGDQIIDKVKLKYYMAIIKSSKDWEKEITLKKNFNDIQIKIHGFASTNPERGGWSITKTADFFGESKGTTSTDIKLAEAIIANPELRSFRNKTEAKKRSNQTIKGVKNKANDDIFEFEASLQDHLMENWEKLPLGREWTIHTRDIFSKGKYNTGEIGEMDFLAKHKTKPKWLVIELKRNPPSAATVGQILRYMGWVKVNLAGNNETVEGLIIAGSDDDKIGYALLCLQNVKLNIYRMINGKLQLNEPEPIGLISKFSKLPPEKKAEWIKLHEKARKKANNEIQMAKG